MEARPKILILGNGFDLAHYLPTSYTHFMKAMMVLEESEIDTEINFDTLFSEYIENDDEFISKTKELYKTDELILGVDLANSLREKLKINGWFQYFKLHLENIETWIDFESSIGNALTLVCNFLEFEDPEGYTLIEDLQTISPVDQKKIIRTNFVYRNFGKESDEIIDTLTALNVIEKIYVIYHGLIDDEPSYEIVEAPIEPSLLESQRSNTGAYLDPKVRVFHSINNSFLRNYGSDILGFKNSNILNDLGESLSGFINLFDKYIDKIVNEFLPKVELKKPNIFEYFINAIYSFNYSNTQERLYKTYYQYQFLHGKSGESNPKLVMGIEELNNPVLKENKSYQFVKYYQKLVNNTDYTFLKQGKLFNSLLNMRSDYPIEIIFWGHSLDVSDKDYIEEVFSFNDDIDKKRPAVMVIVYYHSTPHKLLANLIHILGKELIERWMKKEWLEFKKAPDIYAINFPETNFK